MRLKALGLSLGLAGMLAAGTAFAAPVTFVFQNPGADAPLGNFTTTSSCIGIAVTSGDRCATDQSIGFNFLKSGISLNAKAISGGNTFALLQDLTPTNSGLAVLTAGESNSDDQIQIERNEAIVFAFSPLVRVLAIDFNAGADRNCATPGSEGPCGNFSLFVDGSAMSSFSGEAKDNMGFNLTGSMFRILHTGPRGSGFTIGSITVDVAKVPEPATLGLLGLGLAGLGLVRRRRAA